jgi:hypothetical protein
MIKIFLKNKLKKIAREYSGEKTFREYKDIRKIVLLFDMEDLPVVEAFVKTLLSEKKQVSAYSFDSKKTIYPQLPDYFKIWNKNKLDFWGIPHSSDISAFKADVSDTLIDLTKGSSPILQYLSQSSSASFRVGFNLESSKLYDLLIERNQDQDFPFFVDQLLFYMKSLRTK